MKTEIVNGITKFYNDEGKPLMSYSTMTKPFTQDKFDKIPAFILDKAKEFGSNITIGLIKAITNKTSENELTDKQQLCVKLIIDKIIELKLEPKTLEKHIWNDKWHGYLDIDCDNCFIEIKTRNTDNLELSTITQCEIYKRITGKDYYVFQFNKKTMKLNVFESGKLQETYETNILIPIANKIIDAFEYIYDNLK